MTTDLESAVSAWPGVVAGPHRFAGTEFTVGGREFGHVHGTRQVDIPFPKGVRDAVVDEGRTSKHHLYPDSGWVTKYLHAESDVEQAVWLLRLSYLLHVAALQRRPDAEEAIRAVDVAAETAAMDLSAGLREMFAARTGGRTRRASDA
ncbi:luciferase domain-containing protein [Halogeometricum limi]|uniref:Luciferase domain-containing protein n=1 Tax=Halogeometricum limi TaxID=555875 RepID=A0A1I6I3A0_9EURY|nr:luciferase family protein [Halogeometricum limi]SFR61098.1 hypothetical protein SAMN04488124_2753 [Halogeometricum limi]